MGPESFSFNKSPLEKKEKKPKDLGTHEVPLKHEGVLIKEGKGLRRETGEKEADLVFENALRHLGNSDIEINPTFVENAKAMAKFSGIKETELSEEIPDLYAILRDDAVSLNEKKEFITKYFVTMGDQKLFAEELYLLGDDEKLRKVLDTYKDTFHQEVINTEGN